MKIKYKVIISIVVIFGLLQLYRPNKNEYKPVTETDFLISERAPDEVSSAFKRACYDCHSSQTNYDWFDNIAPISWYVDNNIKKGKYALNFSDWNTFQDLQKQMMYLAIPFDVNSEDMPPKNYLKLHPEAKLTLKEKEKITNWLDQITQRFIWENH